MRLRLHYERRTWPTRHEKIQLLCQTSITNIGNVEEGIVNLSSFPHESEGLDDEVAEQLLDPTNALLREGLMEVHRLLTLEIQYPQAIIAEYLMMPVNQRGMLYRSLRALRTHIENVATEVTRLLAALAPWTREATFGERNGFIEECEDRLETCEIEGEGAREAMVFFVKDFLSSAGECQQMHGRLSSQLNRLNELPAILRDLMISPQRRERLGLPSVYVGMSNAIIRRTVKLGLGKERAALREIAHITHPWLQNLVRLWVVTLNQTRVARRVANALELVSGRQSIEEIDRRLSRGPVPEPAPPVPGPEPPT
ncbi:hypothetical protein N0V82_010415 [Gnomoniopsis sp. IMI 355080]|nr:hypothetical protein N0V82_010415 [Gnomoniopsis sp. IMI 355080]